MTYVIAAYALTFVVVGGYALSIVMRRREVERALHAWSELDTASDPWSDGLPPGPRDASSSDEA